jgi:CheY-like chemotaxis protein
VGRSIAPVGNAPARLPTRSLREVAESIAGERVLLVEDNPTNQIVARRLLQKMGLEVDLAVNGSDAVEHVAQKDYRAVLMDLQMPVMDGFEATLAIRLTERGKHLPIIAMTAAALLEDREATVRAGMNAHVAKPMDPVELAGVLVRCIREAGA